MTVILDFVLTEGPIGFVRTGLVLLKSMQTRLKSINDTTELNNGLDSEIANMTDCAKFKQQMRDVYINQRLMNICRQQNIDSKQRKYHESMVSQKTRTQEKCIESSPYCHWERNAKFKDFHDSVFRCANLQDSLKFNYFDPFDFVLDSKPYGYLKQAQDPRFMREDKFSTHSHRTASNLLQKSFEAEPDFDLQTQQKEHSKHMEEMVTKREKVVSSRKGSIEEVAKDIKLKAELGKLGSGGGQAQGSSAVGLGGKTVAVGESPVVLKQAYFDKQTGGSRNRCQLSPSEVQRAERELVIVRCPHICHFEKREYEILEVNNRDKSRYFLIVNSILYKFMGKRIEEETGQTKNVLSGPREDTDPAAGGHKTRILIRRQVARRSLDNFTRFCSRYSSLNGHRRGLLPRSRADVLMNGFEVKKTAVKRVLDRQNSVAKVQLQWDDNEDQINVASFRSKYKNAFFVNEEELRKDVEQFTMTLMSPPPLVAKHSS